MKNQIKLIAVIGFVTASSMVHAASVVLVGNGAASGAIIVTSTGANIDLATRVRVGTFLNVTSLNNTIANFLSGANNSETTLSLLNSNFTDLGTNVTNYGDSSQVGTGISATQAVFNTPTTLTVNGTSASRNVFNGQIKNVAYTSSIGISTPVYIWTTFNNEIGIVRGSTWTTPTSDLTGLTLNLNVVNASSGVLLGTYQDYATGTDLIKLVPAAVPEPSTGLLLVAGFAGLALVRSRRKS